MPGTRLTRLLAGAVAVLLVGLAVLGYVLVTRDEEDLRPFASSGEKDCSSITGTDNRAELGRIVPDARSFKVTTGKTLSEKFGGNLRCEVRADGETAVEIMLEGATGKADWGKEMKERSLLWPSGRHPVKYAFGEGWSGSRAAALYLPCPGQEATARGGYKLTVVAQPKESKHEKDLLRLAERTAKFADRWLKCEKAPDGR